MTQKVYSAIQPPDGTILESFNRHDYVTHEDTVSGEHYMLDGGLEYTRGSVNKVQAKDLSVYTTDPHEKVREYVTWGTYGKDGKQPYRRVKLCDMESEHIQACLDTQHLLRPSLRIVFQTELAFRNIDSTKTKETV